MTGSTVSGTDRWLRRFRPRPDAPLLLVCFPHAGAGASFFRDWPAGLPPAVDLAAVQYAGREDRLREAPVTDMAELADQLCAALLPVLGRRFAFFGHSMGAAVAFEVAVRLRERAGVGPVALLASACRPPDALGGGQIHLRDDAGLVAELRRLGGADERLLAHPELLELYLPTLRADYRLIETYRPADRSTVDCPVVACVGDRDPQVGLADADGWRRHTTGPFRLRVFPGDHFYLVPRRLDVLDEVRAAVATG